MMAIKTSGFFGFWVTALFGTVALASLTFSVASLFFAPTAMLHAFHRAELILGFCYLIAVVYVSTFGYRPYTKYIFGNRNGFPFSPTTAIFWMMAAAVLPARFDIQVDPISRLTGIGVAALLAWVGWRLRGPKEQPAFLEQRDELDDREMTRLKLV